MRGPPRRAARAPAGINIPRIVRFRTLACKAFGVLFSVAGALPVGKEGPMIHSGSVIGAALAQGTRSLGGGDFRVLEFRTDPEKRDFVACGAAAGVGRGVPSLGAG